MKAFYFFTISTILLLYSCKKDGDSATIDTNEYVMFTITGGGFNNERITIDKSNGNKPSAIKIDNKLLININRSGRTLVSLSIKAKQPGTYSFENDASAILDLEGRMGYPSIWGKTGFITITQYSYWPWTQEYYEGTFEGQFSPFFQNDTFSITHGKFRIKPTY
ncbi:MAG: hypothetical protein V4590_07965 [Bacteroidota bacterium]